MIITQLASYLDAHIYIYVYYVGDDDTFTKEKNGKNFFLIKGSNSCAVIFFSKEKEKGKQKIFIAVRRVVSIQQIMQALYDQQRARHILLIIRIINKEKKHAWPI